MAILTVLIAVSVALYIEDTPYRNLRSMIKNQSLTAEMCDWKNRNSEDSYYNYLTSEKGRKFLASELTKLHRNDDVSKAMWLLCIQPNSINGFELWASPSFIQWIVGYAKNNGVRSTDQSGYNVNYSVDDYRLTMNSYDDKESDFSDISGFSVSDGNNRITIDNRSRYKNTIPAIN